MSVTFVYKIGEISKKITLPMEKTILDLKKHIVNEIKQDVNEIKQDVNEIKQDVSEIKQDIYVDLNLILSKTIRSFGKMTLESGLFPRSMDTLQLNNYNIESKEINCEYIVVDNYFPPIIEEKSNNNPSSSIYRPRMKNESDEDKTFNINSEVEFPSL
jgi:hypothetical protein